jgi:hypothetical protein
MTRVEAWEKWLIENNFHTGQAKSALEHSSHGRTFTFAWEMAKEHSARLCESMQTATPVDCAKAIRNLD